MIKFYNTLHFKKEPFIPLEEGKVTMYACGPTVYNFFHVGNARCFTVFDMLRRYLEYRGYDVTFVQNFTDIDDKVIRKANEEGTTYQDIASRYIKEYYTDAMGLGIKPATHHPLATDHMDTIIDIVKTLVDKGYAYPANGDVYFRTRKCKSYGQLSGKNIEDLESGARIEVTDIKEDPLDFALWKSAKPGEPSWTSPWGEGRPGWHIECSAMNKYFLGDTIDIHCGGQDLIFPHHENEIAQSECCNGAPFARYWMHNGYINVDNQKMSKSLNNFFTVREISEKYGYLPIRYFLLSSHYRSPINFSEEVILQAENALERIFNCRDDLNFFLDKAPEEALREDEKDALERLEACRVAMIEAMDDDLNTGNGIAALFDLIRECNTLCRMPILPSHALILEGKKIFDEITTLFGFVKEDTLDTVDTDKIAQIEAAITARAEAKKAKDYALADKIRAELLADGVILKDTAQGTTYTFAE